MFLTVMPFSRNNLTALTIDSFITVGRPRRTPLRRALSNPDATRSRIRLRSSSATLLRIVKTHLPVAVVVSIPSR